MIRILIWPASGYLPTGFEFSNTVSDCIGMASMRFGSGKFDQGVGCNKHS